MAKSGNKTDKAKKAAILKELESVKTLLDEDQANHDQKKAASAISPEEAPEQTRKEEFQIPLLDPGKSTTNDLDDLRASIARKKAQKTEIEPETKPTAEIPTIDDITQSGSLFDEEEEEDAAAQQQAIRINTDELKEHAQLLIQDILNEVIPQFEERLMDMIPPLEEGLKKQLEQKMNTFIDDKIDKS